MSNKPEQPTGSLAVNETDQPSTIPQIFEFRPSQAVVFSTRIAIGKSGITYTAPGGESAEWDGSVLGYEDDSYTLLNGAQAHTCLYIYGLCEAIIV